MKLFVLCLFTSISALPCFGKGNLITYRGFAQSSTFCIKYYNTQNRDITHSIDSILEEVNRTFSIFDSLSLVNQLNKNTTSVCSALFAECFTISHRISEATGGAFDVTVAPWVNAYGFGNSKKHKTSFSEINDSTKALVGYKKITLIGDTLVKMNPGITLNFNAIAQGFSIDKIAEFLLGNNIEDFIVEVGGEIRAHGKKENGEPWSIGVETPIVKNSYQKGGTIMSVQLDNRSKSTSGNVRNYYIQDSIVYSHTIDPAIGKPARNSLLTATIVAPTCAYADALATACMVKGLQGAIALIEALEDVEACFLYTSEKDEFEMYLTGGFTDILNKNKN